MTSFYLGLALVLALTLNARPPLVRALGSLAAATALALLAWSIVLANRDGTFAAATGQTPLLLNIIAALATAAAALLLWSLPRLFRRPPVEVPLRSTTTAYGHVTRSLHWAAATLIIAAFCIGKFISILPEKSPLHPEYVAVHMAVGGAVFLLTFARMFERLVRPAPPNPLYVHLAHFALYTVVVASCVTGLAMAGAPVHVLGLSLPNLPPHPIAPALHEGLLPALLLILLAAHFYGAIKPIRRMLR